MGGAGRAATAQPGRRQPLPTHPRHARLVLPTVRSQRPAWFPGIARSARLCRSSAASACSSNSGNQRSWSVTSGIRWSSPGTGRFFSRATAGLRDSRCVVSVEPGQHKGGKGKEKAPDPRAIHPAKSHLAARVTRGLRKPVMGGEGGMAASPRGSRAGLPRAT